MIKNNIINHVAMIMDGNTRWAIKNNVTKKEGYLNGFDKIDEVTNLCIDNNIKHLTLFALSTENFKRASINMFFDIIHNNYKMIFDKLANNKKIKIKIIGERHNLPNNIKKKILKIEKETSKNKILNLNIAFNYGFMNELLNLVNNIVDLSLNKITIINEKLIRKNLYLIDSPDPDILIRTGGFNRLSNFLLLQLSYTELFFTKTLWPDLSKKEILKIFEEYYKIERKYGL